MWSYDAISASCKDPSQITADDVMGSNIERRLFARKILLDERAGSPQGGSGVQEGELGWWAQRI